MNYAQTYNIGNYQHTRSTATTEVTQTIKRVRQLDATTQGCKRNTKRQTQISSDSHATDNFLKYSFLPKLKIEKSVQPSKESKKTERDFYKSLYQLAEHYGIDPMPTKDFDFPYNLALAMADVEQKLKNKVLHWEEIRLVQDRKKTYLVSEERYNTGTVLFYIPVSPLYRLMRDKKHKRNALLLLSVCAYLYHVAEIPYHRQETSYLCWTYEMMSEWIEYEDDTEATEVYLSEIEQAAFIGDYIEKRLYNYRNLTLLKERIEKFRPKDEFDKRCIEIAKETFEIFQTYPNEKIFRNATPNGEVTPEDMEDVVGMEKYISFYADHSGWLYDTLLETVNYNIQEYGHKEEPIIHKQFNGSDITDKNLCFENRIFELLYNLTEILEEY